MTQNFSTTKCESSQKWLAIDSDVKLNTKKKRRWKVKCKQATTKPNYSHDKQRVGLSRHSSETQRIRWASILNNNSLAIKFCTENIHIADFIAVRVVDNVYKFIFCIFVNTSEYECDNEALCRQWGACKLHQEMTNHRIVIKRKTGSHFAVITKCLIQTDSLYFDFIFITR